MDNRNQMKCTTLTFLEMSRLLFIAVLLYFFLLGYRYGIIACNGCSYFFSRAIQRRTNNVCCSDKRCVVNKKYRHLCPYCRMQKCLAAGMRPEAVGRRLRGRISNSAMASNAYGTDAALIFTPSHNDILERSGEEKGKKRIKLLPLHPHHSSLLGRLLWKNQG